MILVDTHAHLDMPQFERDLEEVLARGRERGIAEIITIGTDISSIKKAIALVEKYHFIWAAVGIHPHDAKTFNKSSYLMLKELASHEKVVAIGEVGLDFYRNLSPHEKQLYAFKSQINLARELGKPLIIHCRDAISEVWQVLKEENGFSLGGVWHCFSGDVVLANACIKERFFISIGGIITFPKAEKLKALVKEISLEHTLLETDAPFLAPVPMRGKRNEPSFLYFIAEEVAKIKQKAVSEVAKKTTENARYLFKIT